MNLPPLPETAMPEKNERNRRVQRRLDELGQEGKHGYYETIFRVVQEEVEQAQREAVAAAVPEQLAIDKIKFLADEYASRCSEFARSLALGKPDDSMSPVSSAAGDTRMALHNAIDLAFCHQSPADRVAAAVPEWQPIETAPKDQTFLAVLDCGGDQTICTMRWSVAEQKNSLPHGDFLRERVTHWMPLPELPKSTFDFP